MLSTTNGSGHSQSDFNVVIGMMQRDEDTRLEAWILYHSYHFGFDSLHIFDNGSKSPHVLSILKKYQGLGVHVDYSQASAVNYTAKGDLIANLFNLMEQDPRNRFFIPLDCDEFITVRKSDGELTGDSAELSAYLRTLLQDPHILIARDANANILGHPGHFFPSYDHHKVFFTEGCCSWMSEGFHTAHSRKSDVERLTDVVYLHFHYRPYREMVTHSRRKLEHLVDVTDPEKLREYKGTANHVSRYLSMADREYDNGFHPETGFHVPWLVPLLSKLGVSAEFFDSI